MKVGDCKWLRVGEVDMHGTQNIEDTTMEYKGNKWCNVQRTGVEFQISYSRSNDTYQIVTNYTDRRRADGEYASCFYCNTLIELAAFLQDKEPL